MGLRLRLRYASFRVTKWAGTIAPCRNCCGTYARGGGESLPLVGTGTRRTLQHQKIPPAQDLVKQQKIPPAQDWRLNVKQIKSKKSKVKSVEIGHFVDD